MPNCLGLYIEENLIKYAKVSKEQNGYKIEAFGTKFYENITEAVNQIVEETNSYKIPISVNIFGETYSYFNMSTLLPKNDLPKAIKTEFEFDCSDKGVNPTAFETRNAIVNNIIEKDKYKVLHVAQNKADSQKRSQDLKEVDVRFALPLPFSIVNLVDAYKKENYMIVNIEKDTVVTTVLDNQLYEIDVIEEGSQDFLEKINEYENSYSKAYEIVKNTTIYTSTGDGLEEEQQHLNDIVNILYNIVSRVMKMVNTSIQPIQKVYITGTGALVNNVELYFQEYLSNCNCEILKPYFAKDSSDTNIKEYIEVNSAVALAMTALGEGVQGLNFTKGSVTAGLFAKGPKKPKEPKKIKEPKAEKTSKSNLNFSFDLGEGLDRIEKSLVRTATGILIFVLGFSGFSMFLGNEIIKKEEEASKYIESVNGQIAKAKADSAAITTKQGEYENLIKSIQEASDKINERNKTRNAVPNLLNQIMAVIPQDVQITSIQNLTGTKVVIEAQAEKYEQLGFLIAEIKTGVILNNVITTSGAKSDSIVTIKIEGDLP